MDDSFSREQVKLVRIRLGQDHRKPLQNLPPNPGFFRGIIGFEDIPDLQQGVQRKVLCRHKVQGLGSTEESKLQKP